MSSLLFFGYDVLTAPMISIYIVISLWTYVKILLNEWELKNFNINYNDCCINSQWWRILTAPLCHSTFIHFLLNISTLWSLRFIEKLYGSIFLLKYTIIIGIFEACMTLYSINFIIKYSRIGRDFSGHPVINSSLFGFTSILLGWLGFLSIDLSFQNNDILFYLFGVIPLPLAIAPIIIMLISQCMVPRTHSISHAGGLAGGYLLAFGILKILPNLYWTICFFIDIALLCLYTSDSSDVNTRRPQTRSLINNNNNEDIIEIFSYHSNDINNERANNDIDERNNDLRDLEEQPLLL